MTGSEYPNYSAGCWFWSFGDVEGSEVMVSLPQAGSQACGVGHARHRWRTIFSLWEMSLSILGSVKNKVSSGRGHSSCMFSPAC